MTLWASTTLSSLQENSTEKIEHLNLKTFYILLPMVVLLSVLIATGVSGNLLVFLVYLKQFKASSTRVFVLEMSVCDFLTNVSTLPLLIVDMRYRYTRDGHYCQTMWFLGTFPVLMSYLTLVCVALDRRRRICQVHRRQLSARQAAYLLIVPFTLTFALVFPFTFFYDAVPLLDNHRRKTCWFTHTVWENASWVVGILLMGYFIVGFVLLTASYSQISYQSYQQKKRLLTGNANIVDSVKNMSESTFVCYLEPEEYTKLSVQEESAGIGKKQPKRNRKKETRFISHDAKNKPRSCERKSCLEDNIDTHESQYFPMEAEGPGCSYAADIIDIDCQAKEIQKSSFSCAISPSKSTALSLQSLTVTSLDNPNTTQPASSYTASQREGLDESARRSGFGQRKRALLSRTTFMMFVLTATTVICCVPYITLS